MKKSIISLLLAFLLAALPLWAAGEPVLEDGLVAMTDDIVVEYGLPYSAPDEVALYIHVFQQLPVNFITKSDAQDLGWISSQGNLWDVTDHMSIGGDTFGNREGLLPKAKGRQYYECDVNYDPAYDHGRRGLERVVFSNDGLVYYTSDHYNTYTLLYDGWYDDDYWLDHPDIALAEGFTCYVDYSGYTLDDYNFDDVEIPDEGDEDLEWLYSIFDSLFGD